MFASIEITMINKMLLMFFIHNGKELISLILLC